MAKLNFKYATMNSGKTLDLIRTVYNYEENGYQVLVLKPLIDTKGENKISSRTGLERKVDFLISEDDNILDLLSNSLENIECIFIDEAQFLKKQQIDELFLISKAFHISIICYGLRTNFKMESFEGSKRLLEIADELEELKTICRCGEIARYVGRKVNGIFVKDGEEVVIDGTDDVEYVPLCGECYLRNVDQMDFKQLKVKTKRRRYHGR